MSDGISRVSTAYESSDRARSAYRESARVLIIVLSCVVNWIFIFSGLARPPGLYALIIYTFAIYVLLCAIERCGAPSRCDIIDDDRPEQHLHSLGYSSALQTSILVWLGWFISTHLFFEADLLYSYSRLPVLLMFVASAGTIVARYQSAWRLYEIVASHVFFIIFVASLGFPATVWVPQTSWSIGTLGRVFLFFFTSNLIDIFSRLEAVTEQDVVCDREASAGRRSVEFCATMESANMLVTNESQRTRRIMAQSAWILVISGRDGLLYGLGLVAVWMAVYGNLYERLTKLRRTSVAVAPQQPEKTVPRPVSVNKQQIAKVERAPSQSPLSVETETVQPSAIIEIRTEVPSVGTAPVIAAKPVVFDWAD